MKAVILKTRDSVNPVVTPNQDSFPSGARPPLLLNSLYHIFTGRIDRIFGIIACSHAGRQHDYYKQNYNLIFESYLVFFLFFHYYYSRQVKYMAQKTDLYSILISYANKNNSPYIEIDAFLDFLGKYAKKQSIEQPEWLKWVEDRNVKFWAEVSVLAEDDKCELLTDTGDGRIYMHYFYLDLIGESYSNADKDADLPFPSEESLRISFPENQLRTLSSMDDIIIYLQDQQTTDIPILKIIFPYGFGSALVLASIFSRRLMEMAILKIRNYLKRSGNKEYALRKLSPQLQGRDSFLREQINQILIRPMETCRAIEEGRELSYLFWAHFCILVKNDIKKKKDYLGEDIAALQSVFLIETFNGYYKSLANKRRDEELAFRALENNIAKLPFIYTMEQIFKFRDSHGMPLLGQYSKEALDLWVKKKTTESKSNELPPLLVIKSFDDVRHLCFKDKMLPLCFRLLSEGRKTVIEAVSRRWRKLLLEYRHEPAMEDNNTYEELLSKLTAKLCPLLSVLLADPKLLLIYEEVENSQNASSILLKIFNKGQLLPYSSLYMTPRKEMLADARLALPFWYSTPVLTALIAFFKNIFKEKKSADPADESDEIVTPEEKTRIAEISAAAEDLELTMVPSGYTLDTYLEQLESRWSKLIDKKARENLIADVKSLIRDHLRMNLKLQKKFQLTRSAINQMAVNAIIRSPALSGMNDRDSLVLYSELYLLKLLQNIR